LDNVKTYSFSAEEEVLGERLDKALVVLLEVATRSHVQKLIESGEVLINETQIMDKNYRIAAGDRIEIRYGEPAMLSAAPEDIPLEILYEDDDLLVVEKPKGMVVHPAPGNPDGTLVNAVLFHCKDRLSTINGVIRPGIVHRIDKDTSGLLMIAKNDKAHKSLAEQLSNHTITRKYQAIVYNLPSADAGSVNGPIGRDPKNRLRMAVTPVNSKPAVTRYRVLERFDRFAFIEAQLETGRTHQIRVHMAYIGHPLLGDPVYGPKKPFMDIKGQMLHAGTLGFTHPSTQEYMEFNSPLPKEFEEVLERLRR
jgi:23S rRNA pseudouridine1911/1915/1917 synthase